MKTDIISTMRFVAMLAFLPAVAFGVTVETLPQSEYADTEVSTNIPFEVSFDTMSRVNFALSLDASPSNSVEVSIGGDANGDGNLSPEEAAYTFGFDCGRWFKRDAVLDEVKVIGEGEQWTGLSSRVTRMFTLKKRTLDEAWNLIKVTRRGVAETCEVALVEGRKPGKAVIVR